MTTTSDPPRPALPRAYTPDFWLAYAANVLVMSVVALFYRFGDLINELGGTDQTLGLVVATGSFCGVLARTRLTALVSRFNLHAVWLVSIAAMLAGAAVVMSVAAAHTGAGELPVLLVVGRILFAAGAAGGLGLPVVFVQKTTAAEQRGEAVGFASGGVFVGMMLGAGLSELVFRLMGDTPARFPVLFAVAAGAALLGMVCVAVIYLRNAPLLYEALPPTATAKSEPVDTEAARPRYALLALGVGTGYAFTFCTVYLTRYLTVQHLGGYLTFFFAYCASAFIVAFVTRSWGKLVGHYRMALIGTFVNVLGTLLFLTVTASWHLIFPAVLCGIARAFVNPALVGLAESSGASQRTVKGAATNRVFLALDAGNFLAALTMGLVAHAYGYGVTLAVTAALVVAGAATFVAREHAAGAARNLRRRRDDFRSRRKSDYGDGNWQQSGSRVRLVYVKKPSGIRLDGAWAEPKPSPEEGEGNPRPLGEIVLMIHADGDDFCSPSILETLQNYYLERGLPVLRVNTSGKGVINTYNVGRGEGRYGTVYEVLHDCLGEIDTWFEWLQRQGYERVTLVGHRLGAVKALYYAAEGQAAGIVCRVVALSPPRLAHDFLLQHDTEGAFAADLERARQLVAAGKPDAYFEAEHPFADLTSARSYLDKYGPDARYDLVRFLPRVACPALVMLGSLDEKTLVLAKGLARDLRALGPQCPHLHVEVVAGANQYYSSVREKAVVAVDGWLGRVTVEARDASGAAAIVAA